MAAVSDAAGALVDSLGGIADLSHDQLGGLVAAARTVQARLDAVTAEAVGEVGARGTYTLDGAVTLGSWLRQRTRLTPAAAAGLAATARVLRSGLLPATRTALATGELSGEHARVIATGVTGAPAGAVALIEPEVVHTATHADLRATAGVLRAFRHALDPDAADAAALARYERAGITLTPTLDGPLAIHGSADEVTGALLATAIDTAGPLVTGDKRTAARRRLDALADICRAYLADPDTPRRGGGGHPHLLITIDHATHTTDHHDTGVESDLGPRLPADDELDDDELTETAALADQPAALAEEPGEQTAETVEQAGAQTDAGGWGGSPGGTLSWIGRIAGSTARRAGCDAQHTLVTLGPDGEIIEAGTARRFFTQAQRRAMIARDGDRCPVPYCDRPISWADAHHLIPVGRHGPTTVANGAIPCDGHHTLLHEGHWQLHRLPDGRYLIHHPNTGRTIGPEEHPPGHNRPTPRPPPDDPDPD
jgi:hypothetical protein